MENIKNIINKLNITRFGAESTIAVNPTPTSISPGDKDLKTPDKNQNPVFTSVYDLFNTTRPMSDYEKQQRDKALALFGRDYNIYRQKLAGHSDAAKDKFEEKVMNALKSQKFEQPLTNIDGVVAIFNTEYPKILDQQLKNISTEMGLDISSGDAAKLIGGKGKGEKPDWKLEEWFNTLTFLYSRANQQAKDLQVKRDEFEEGDPQRTKYDKLLDIKRQYAAATQRLRQEMQQIQKAGINGKEFIPGQEIPDDLLSGGGGFGGGKGSQWGRLGQGGGGYPGAAVRGTPEQLNALKGKPFFVGNKDLIYIKPLLEAYQLEGQYPELDKGPMLLSKQNWIGANFERASIDLRKAENVDPPTYFDQLAKALREIYGRYTQYVKESGKPIDDKQDMEYTRLIDPIQRLATQYPPIKKQEKGKEATPAAAKEKTPEQKQADLKNMMTALSEKGFKPTEQYNNIYWHKTGEKTGIAVVTSDYKGFKTGQVYVTDSTLASGIGENRSWKLIGNFDDPNVIQEINRIPNKG